MVGARSRAIRGYPSNEAEKNLRKRAADRETQERLASATNEGVETRNAGSRGERVPRFTLPSAAGHLSRIDCRNSPNGWRGSTRSIPAHSAVDHGVPQNASLVRV